MCSSDEKCKGCGRIGGFYPSIGLCGRCRDRARWAFQVFEAVIVGVASDDRLATFLERLSRYQESVIHGGELARFVEATQPPEVVVDVSDGWDLCAEAA